MNPTVNPTLKPTASVRPLVRAIAVPDRAGRRQESPANIEPSLPFGSFARRTPGPLDGARLGRDDCRVANLEAPALVLASGSPRRKRLLEDMGLAFTIQPADVCEDALPSETPRALVERLALAKAGAIAAEHPHPTVVLGSDTVVVLGGDVLGKPRDPEHAVELLSRLVGQTHQVLTGVALMSGDGSLRKVVCVESRVVMRPAEQEELRRYVATGESLDKAGAYALQGEGRRFVVRVEGSETNVIGLPVDETFALLREAGFDPHLP